MSGAGGETTQFGVLYQDKVTALYLGRLIDPRAVNLPTDQQVLEVRGEKPGADVDDIYVRFADEHRLYVQAKTALKSSGKPWNKLWEHFYHQHRRDDFGTKDRLVLLMGDYATWFKDLKTISQNAASSTSLEEWQGRLVSDAHNKLANKIGLQLKKIVWAQEEREEKPPDELDVEDYQRLKTLLSRVDLRFIENEAVESDQLIYWMPESNENLEGLFKKLLSLVIDYASKGRTFQEEGLRQELERLRVTIKPLDQQSELLPTLPDPDELPDVGELPPGSRMPFARNAVFTGREVDLKELAEVLLYKAQEGQTAGIVGQVQATAATGMGGIGKTQLAVEFCYRYGRFFRGVHWMAANQDIATEIVECGLEMGLKPWPEAQKEQVRTTLAAWKGSGPRLVVLDNLEDLHVLQKLRKRLGGEKVLLTSRIGKFPRGLGVKNQRLGSLQREESRALLIKLAPQLEQLDASELDKVAERYQDVPLGLHLAGSYLNTHPELSVEDYLARLKKQGGALKEKRLPDWVADDPTDYGKNLWATFEVGLKALEAEKQLGMAARKMFLASGYCAANVSLPRNMLSGIMDDGDEEEEIDPDLAIEKLVQVGLLEVGDRGLVIHPLLAEFARLQDEEEGGKMLERLAEALVKIKYDVKISGLPERVHVMSVLIRLGQKGKWQKVLDLAWTIQNYLDLQGHWKELIQVSKEAYNAAKELDDWRNQGTWMGIRGNAFGNLGDIQSAIVYYK